MATHSNRWRHAPETHAAAIKALAGKHCLVCDSPLLSPIVRPPRHDYLAHCNHCGTEMLIAVLLNRKAWKV